MFRVQLPMMYRENGVKLTGKFISTGAFTEMVDASILIGVDAIIVNRKRRTVLLAYRKFPPMVGWWEIGGRMLRGETELEGVARCFKRETSLVLSAERFRLVRQIRTLWETRRQEPTDGGIDYSGYVFSVELAEDEIAQASANLDPNEYDAEVGLQEFDREKLVSQNIHSAILDTYDEIFGSCDLVHGVLQIEHKDERRELYEFNDPNGEFSVKMFRMTGAPRPLGNHYHAHHAETFVLTQGSVRVLSCRVNEEGERLEDPRETQHNAPSVIHIPSLIAHTFYVEQGSEMICYSSQVFDPNNMDMLPHILFP